MEFFVIILYFVTYILLMNFDFFPAKIFNAISCIDVDKLYNIRLRVNEPINLRYNNQMLFLNELGLTKEYSKGITCLHKDIEEVIYNVTDKSIYAFNSNIVNGFLTTKDGIRIGVAGECVFSNEKVMTIKNISSLNIRIPHLVPNCSEKIFDILIREKKILNTLIISPPGYGKTTLLKDLVLKLNESNYEDILVIDERGEFSSVCGRHVDTIKFCNKLYAFNIALRSMSPKIVITDELCSCDDWRYVKNAINSGVKIIASAHACTLNEITNKSEYINGLFDLYVVLNDYGRPGCIKDIVFKDELKLG